MAWQEETNLDTIAQYNLKKILKYLKARDSAHFNSRKNACLTHAGVWGVIW